MATMSFLFQGIEIQKGRGEKSERVEGGEEGRFSHVLKCAVVCTVFSFYNRPLLGSSCFKEKLGFFLF